MQIRIPQIKERKEGDDIQVHFPQKPTGLRVVVCWTIVNVIIRTLVFIDFDNTFLRRRGNDSVVVAPLVIGLIKGHCYCAGQVKGQQQGRMVAVTRTWNRGFILIMVLSNTDRDRSPSPKGDMGDGDNITSILSRPRIPDRASPRMAPVAA